MTGRFQLTLGLITLIIGLAITRVPAAAEFSDNLIFNPDLEAGPDGWHEDQWGDNSATFQYESTGYNSAHSISVEVNNLVSGDAKWHATPVMVEPNENYLYRDYYKANVTSLVVAMSLDSSGQPLYFFLGSLPPVADWTEASFAFTTPSTANQLTIFHLLHVDGRLQIDNVYLGKYLESEPSSNLFPNSSAEDGLLFWVRDNWGNNSPAFSQMSYGHESSTSLRVEVTNYLSGDAKWHPVPVPIQAGGRYIFSDYYKSNTRTKIVVMSLNANGQASYFDLAELGPTDSWQNISLEFTAPANSKTLSILHLIGTNGWLMIDDLSLTATEAVSGYSISNPSVEQASLNPELPKDWQPSSWGLNQPRFLYSNDAHTGNKSLRVELTGWVSGDAKWVHEPLALETGGDYLFRVWYKTNTKPRAVVEYELDDGSYYYQGLLDPEPISQNWQEYSGIINVPPNAVRATVFLFLNSNGWLNTDDYSLEPYTYAPFDEGRISLVFDDGFESNISTALPILDNYGFKSSHCYATKYIINQPEQIPVIKDISARGHESCSHTINHLDLTTLDPQALQTELHDSKNYLETLTGTTVSSLSTPYGSYNQAVLEEIKKHYQAHRTTVEGYNSRDQLDEYRLLDQNMAHDTSLNQFKSWVGKAIQDKTWLILTYHEITKPDGQLDYFDTRLEDFRAQMAWLSSTGAKVQRLDQALAELRNQ